MRSTGMRFAVWTGAVYLVLSSPFLLGVLVPSVHEGNVYASAYVLINILPILVVGPLAELLLERFGSHELYESNMVALTLFGMFWVAVAFSCGVVFERFRRHLAAHRQS